MDSIGTYRSGDLHLRIAEDRPESARRRATTYLDTTIPSYLVCRLNQDIRVARHQRLTRIWWKRYRARYDLYVSERVLIEARAGHAAVAAQRIRALESIPVLERDEYTDTLAARLLGPGLLPVNARADAEHIAISAAHSIRFLLTWNCRHLANPAISRNVVRMCERFGLACPEICTPEKLMTRYANEEPTH